MINFIKKHWLVLGLAVLATLLIVYWVQGRSGRSTSKNLPNLPLVAYPDIQGEGLPSDITFNTNPQLQLQVKTYQIAPRNLTPDQAKGIAKSFGFPENPSNISKDAVFGDYYLWLNGPNSLSVRLAPLDLNFNQDLNNFSPPTDGDLPTEQAASNTVLSLLTIKGLSTPDLVYSVSSSKKVWNDSLLEVGISPIINQTKVVDNNLNSQLVTASLGKDGKIYSLLYKSGFISPKELISYPAKNFEEVKSSIFKEGKIVSLGQPIEQPVLLVPTSINIIKIEDALLYYPQQPTLLYPIYILTGVAKTNSGDQPVYIYMPAVNSKYVGK